MARPKKGTRSPAQQEMVNIQHKNMRANVLNFLDSSAPLRIQIEEDFRFNRGGVDQWDKGDRDKLIKEKRPALAFNACAPVVNFLAGYEWERRKDLRYFARGTEDEQIGRLSTALAKYAMDIGHGDLQLHRTFRKGIIGGHQALYMPLNFDYTDDLVEGDIGFEVLPENSFGYSPFSRRYDRNDSDNYWMMYWMPIDEARHRWKNHENILTTGYINDWYTGQYSTTGVPQQVRQVFYNRDTQQVRIIRYFYRKPVDVVLLANHETQEYTRMASEKEAEEKLKAIYDEAGAKVASVFSIQTANSQTALINTAVPGQMQTFATPDEAEKVLDQLKQQVGANATKALEIVTRPTTTMRLSHNVAWDELDDAPSPYGRTDEAGEVVDVDWRFPFMTFVPYQDTDDFLSIKGIVRDIKDPQREINWYLSTAQDKLVRGPKGMLWILKGEHTDLNKLRAEVSRSGFVGEYAATPPQYIPPPSIVQEDLIMVQTMLEAIMRITGINAELLGQTTQKTISGRSIQARQSGGLVGVSSLLMNWAASQQYFGDLLIRRIQQFYSVAKMNRIIGDDQRMQTSMGLMGPQQVREPDEVTFERLKRVKAVDFDVVVDFQDHAPTARQAVFSQLLQMTAAGFPVPPDIILEASEAPYKDVIGAAIQKQGMQPPNEALAKVIGAGQGTSNPSGVNKT
jgi:hypothetical protein